MNKLSERGESNTAESVIRHTTPISSSHPPVQHRRSSGTSSVVKQRVFRKLAGSNKEHLIWDGNISPNTATAAYATSKQILTWLLCPSLTFFSSVFLRSARCPCPAAPSFSERTKPAVEGCGQKKQIHAGLQRRKSQVEEPAIGAERG